MLANYFPHNGTGKVRAKDYVLVRLQCGCVVAVQARVLKARGYQPGSGHEMHPTEGVQHYACPCCDDGNKSVEVQDCNARAKQFVRERVSRECLVLVELAVDMHTVHQARKRADAAIVPDDAMTFAECVLVEFDPLGHGLNPDARSARRQNMTQEHRLHHVLDSDVEKDQWHGALGAWLWRMDASMMSTAAAREHAMQTQFADRLSKAGIQ